jgi:LPXTG-site transpeptidase (sortase) family protein
MSHALLRLATAGLCLGLLTGCTQADVESGSGVQSPAPAAPAPLALHDDVPERIPYTDGSQPVGITIPSVGIEGRIQPVGMTDAVTMQVPRDINVIGWFDRSVVPISDMGNTVLVGHRDGADDPNGIFRRLSDVQRGDTIGVRDLTGRTVEYTVESVGLLGRSDFASSAEDIFDTTSAHHLVLLTCGGEYDRSQGGYQANVVVYATRT